MSNKVGIIKNSIVCFLSSFKSDQGKSSSGHTKISGNTRNYEKYMDLFFVLFSFIVFAAWAWLSPVKDGPDELMRFDLLDYMFNTGKLPRGNDPAITNPIWGFSYAFRPIHAHFLSVLFMKITSIFTVEPHIMLFSARLASCIYGAGTTFFSLKIARKLFPKKADIWVFVAFITFLPQMAYLNSYVNCDSFAIFASAIMIYTWIRGMETKWDNKSCIGLGISLALCALSYVTSYGFLVCSFLFFCFSILLCGEKKWDWNFLIRKGLLVFLVFFIIAGWWFIRNAILYDGDFIGLKAQDLYAEEHAQADFKPSLHWTYANGGLTFASMFSEGKWHISAFKSFIGLFKDFAVYLSDKIYLLYLALFGAGILGCILEIPTLFRVRKDGKWYEFGFFNWAMLIGLIIPNYLNLYASYYIDYQPQGRYSMPMLLPFMYFVTYGISTLIENNLKNKWIKTILRILLGLGLAYICLKAYLVLKATY